MRLPIKDGKPDLIDEDKALGMVDYAVRNGVNYFDTAYVYHSAVAFQPGKSEGFLGKALKHRRHEVQVATKLPTWFVESRADMDRFLDEQLKRLQTDHIDFYLVHALSGPLWAKMQKLGVTEFLDTAIARGSIRHAGFSFHDEAPQFKPIVDGYDWSFCQIQYNFVNEDVQAGTRGLQYAAGKGLGVIVMEPLFGGTLANPPPAVRNLWAAAGPQANPVDLALRWVWNQPEVSLALSGMNTLDQVRQNVAVAERAGVGTLTAAERELLGRVREEYQRLAPIACTKCGYCLPCPHGVNIPLNFELYNQATVYEGSSRLLCRNLYLSLPESQRAAACEHCGTCEDRCPQHLAVAELLERVTGEFER